MAETEYIQPEDLPAEVHEEVTSGGKLRFEFPVEGLSIEDLERDLIIRLMDEELAWRHERLVTRLVKQARLPVIKTMDTFDFTAFSPGCCGCSST